MKEIRLLNDSKRPPFPIADDAPVSEDTRLRYRYLDLRRPRMQRNLILRHKLTTAIRRYFDGQGFLEIETPILTKSTPEGARDYLVPSRVHPGEFFALPQSPQIFKQILMISGMDRYFQICRCFRDEDLRADRQPEFTQVDVEISFATGVARVRDDRTADRRGLQGRRHRRSTAVPPDVGADAMASYGSDKPDLRCGMAIEDLSRGVHGDDLPGVPRNPRREGRRARLRDSGRGRIVAQGAGHAGRRGRVARREGPDLGALHRGRRRAEPDSEDGGRGGDPRGAGAHGHRQRRPAGAWRRASRTRRRRRSASCA